MDSTIRDQRFGADGYFNGREPNDFLRAEAHRIPPGRVLCLAAGEGRNAVFLAALGYAVTAGYSSAGLRKAERLAKERGVVLDLVQADLAEYRPPEDAFSWVVSSFRHLPPVVRALVNARACRALAPGGVLLLEAYTPAQLTFETGGPRDAALLPTLVTLRTGLASLELVVTREVERAIHEGLATTGGARPSRWRACGAAECAGGRPSEC